MTIPKRKRKELEFYKRNGIRLEARFAGVEEDETIRVNGRHPCYVIAEVTTGSQVQRYKSESYLRNPSPYLKDVETIIVYLHPFDSDKYIMDMSFIPE